MDLLQQLKTGTATRHRAIESVVPLLDPNLTPAAYRGYLEALLGYYPVVEQRLRLLPDLPGVLPDLDQRWKTDALRMDCEELGSRLKPEADPAGHPAAVEDLPAAKLDVVPALGTLPEAFGCLYVLEGSTLGGQILVRVVRERLGPQIGDATRFLASYGDQVRPMWQRLQGAMVAALPDAGEQKLAVQSACALFDGLHQWLRICFEQKESLRADAADTNFGVRR